ncbi:MAG: Esterase EstD [Chlamydiae bacterium]|nr:Esterase EstD [Chlamydiota bacterium]
MKNYFIPSVLIGKILFAQAIPDGDWSGTLDVGGIQLTLVLHVDQDEQGKLRASLDSIEQGIKGIQVDTIQIEDKTIKFSIEKLKASYEGIYNENEISGKFTQGGMKAPLIFTRDETANGKELQRLQHPQPPFPYHTEEVSFKNSAADVILSGTLTLPKGKGPFPVTLLIAGSGPCDRDQSGFGHKPFLVLSDHLVRRGIATLRFDKRGVEKSTGNYETATSGDFANDVLAGVEYLKTRKEIQQIGLIGHSLGGGIAPLVATNSKDISFLVLMAGPAVSGEEILYEQGVLLQRNLRISEERIKQDRKLREKVFAIVKQETDYKKVEQKIRTEMEKHFAAVPPDANASGSEGIAVIHPDHIEEMLKRITTPWFRYFLTYDPGEYLKLIKAPILALGAEKDLQIPPQQNLPVIAKILKEAKHSDYTILKFPRLNHLFQTCKTGAISEYATIEETISPTALNAISDWILKKTDKQI